MFKKFEKLINVQKQTNEKNIFPRFTSCNGHMKILISNSRLLVIISIKPGLAAEKYPRV